jgi:hypothetical protein
VFRDIGIRAWLDDLGGERWVVIPRPQAVFPFYDGKTGDLKYAESILAK